MAGSVNKVILVGNLGRDPESRSFQNGGKVVNLRIATSESWKDRATGERKEKTEWHRVVVMNDAAREALEAVRGQHPTHVFTYRGQPLAEGMNNSGWKAARRRAAVRYEPENGSPCPIGFRRIRVHDLKHTFGRRLRAAGVSFEDRQDLLGHKSARITTHYSSAEIGNLIEAANKVGGTGSRKSPALLMLRVTGETVSA